MVWIWFCLCTSITFSPFFALWIFWSDFEIWVLFYPDFVSNATNVNLSGIRDNQKGPFLGILKKAQKYCMYSFFSELFFDEVNLCHHFWGRDILWGAVMGGGRPHFPLFEVYCFFQNGGNQPNEFFYKISSILLTVEKTLYFMVYLMHSKNCEKKQFAHNYNTPSKEIGSS